MPACASLYVEEGEGEVIVIIVLVPVRQAGGFYRPVVLIGQSINCPTKNMRTERQTRANDYIFSPNDSLGQSKLANKEME